MTQTVVASAPGKIVLSGEYAVLDGATAIAMAVDRRVNVTRRSTASGIGSVSAPGYTDIVGQFEIDGDALKWARGDVDFKLFDQVWLSAGEHIGAADFTIDSRALSDHRSGEKFGIGSSAATAVALAAALAGNPEIIGVARRAHTAFQGGSGSGIDIATSVHGGLIEYQMAHSRVTSMTWPEDLYFRVIWSGAAASTRDRVAAYGRVSSDPKRSGFLAAAAAMAQHWRDGIAATIVTAYADYNAALNDLSDELTLGVYDSGHRELCALAQDRGLAYKPCGAGGGDVGIVLATSNEAIESFLDELPTGFSVLDCSIDPSGVTVCCS